MWQNKKRDSRIVNLVLWLALTTTPTVATLWMSHPVSAQDDTDTPTFALPQTVEKGTKVRIDGANGLAAFNQNLKQSFEQQFSGTQVEIATNGTEAALKALQEGTIDIAAIARDLTPAEKAQGLAQVPIHREKIAIIVGTDNPFKGSLTDKQFADIFRGRITNWSELGSADAKIRLVDRPENSVTREALRDYPVFRSAKFATGSNATQLTEDNTAEIVKQLGKDGISYAKANQASKLPGVRVLALHDTLPDSPKYPFSQPLVYVYKQNPNPAIAAFLGFALAPPGRQAIEAARLAEAEAIAQAESKEFISANPTITLEATPGGTAAPVADSASDSTGSNFTQPSTFTAPANPRLVGRNLLWWLLLPVGAIAGLLLWFIRRPSPAKETNNLTESPTNAIDNFQDGIPASEPPVATDSTEDTMASAGLAHPAPQKTTNTPLPLPPELEQSPWDMEAPATIVNSAYPPRVEVPKTTTDAADETWELADTHLGENNHHNATIDDLTTAPPEDVTNPETTANIWSMISDDSEDTAVTPAFPDLSDFAQNQSHRAGDVTSEQPQAAEISIESLVEEPEATTETHEPTESASDESDPLTTTLQLDLPTLEEPATEPQFTEIADETLNLVADAAEPPENQILKPTEATNFGNLANEAALAPGFGEWANIDGIQDIPETPQAAEAINAPEENSAPVQTISADVQQDEDSSIVLKPRNPEWAFVTWYLAHRDQQELGNAGIGQLLLRLYDVTQVDLSYQQPHVVEQYECQPGTTDRYVSIPASDRSYMIEIGYVTAGDQWVKIARSAIVHIFSRAYTEDVLADTVTGDEESQISFTPRTAKWAYISWQISEIRQQMLLDAGISQLTLRLYDVTHIDLSYQSPQLVQQYECEAMIHDRYIAIPQSDRDYMVEIGYLESDRWLSIACSPIVRVFSRPHGDFWFVTDAELIIHGATDPGATVNIAGKPISLKSDGTFHLRIPFSEELIDYLITVSTANGEQTTKVHKKFSQETVEG